MHITKFFVVPNCLLLREKKGCSVNLCIIPWAGPPEKFIHLYKIVLHLMGMQSWKTNEFTGTKLVFATLLLSRTWC